MTQRLQFPHDPTAALFVEDERYRYMFLFQETSPLPCSNAKVLSTYRPLGSGIPHVYQYALLFPEVLTDETSGLSFGDGSYIHHKKAEDVTRKSAVHV